MEESCGTDTVNPTNEFLERNATVLQRKYFNTGYREGVTAGQDYYLQEAFNQGFKVSAKWFVNFSKYRGVLSGILVLLQVEKLPTDHVQDAINKLDELEKDDRIFIHLKSDCRSNMEQICHLHPSLEKQNPEEAPFINQSVDVDLLSEKIKSLTASTSNSDTEYKSGESTIKMRTCPETNVCQTCYEQFVHYKHSLLRSVEQLIQALLHGLSNILNLPELNEIKAFLEL